MDVWMFQTQTPACQPPPVSHAGLRPQPPLASPLSPRGGGSGWGSARWEGQGNACGSACLIFKNFLKFLCLKIRGGGRSRTWSRHWRIFLQRETPSQTCPRRARGGGGSGLASACWEGDGKRLQLGVSRDLKKCLNIPGAWKRRVRFSRGRGPWRE